MLFFCYYYYYFNFYRLQEAKRRVFPIVPTLVLKPWGAAHSEIDRLF